MRRYLLPLVAGLPLFASCVDTGVTSFNASPVIVILSHVDGDQVRANEVITLRAGASDPDNGPDTLMVTWFINEEIVCDAAAAADDGTSECEVVLDEDDTDVRVEVRDPGNASSSVRVNLDVLPTQAPQAYVVSPEPGVAYYSDQLIAFQGLLLDWEDDPTELVAWWELDGVGDLGLDATPDDQGSTLDFGVLPEGEHALTLHVTDTEGRTGFDTAIITVGAPNSPPDCAIVSPGDGSSGEQGVEVVFEGTASDPDVSPDRLTASWTSDQDGYLGQSVPDSAGALSLATSSLSPGTHAVTLVVTDDVGATCADVVLFSVGGPPTVSLDDPLLGDVYSDTEAVLFSATVSDLEDRAQDLQLSWVSTLQGEFNTDPAGSSGQAAFVVSDLAIGTHDVTVTVTDSDGLYALAVTTFTIDGAPSAPEVSLAPDPAVTSDDLVATVATDSVDPDGNPVSYSWSWTVDGVASAASTTETLPASATAKGEAWRVYATPNDGTLDGPAGSAEVVIANTAPSVASATLTPDPADEGDTLTCTPGATSDADGDAVATTVSWSVDGVTLTGLGGTLDGTYFDRGEAVFCTVTPDDGGDSGTPVDSNTVTVGNSAPSLSSVSITPDPPVAGDVLTCTASGFSDADGDADATSYAWLLNGTSDGTGTSYAGAFVRGDVVTCEATPDDGTDTGTPVSTSVTVANSPPSLASASISPDPAAPTDTLTCSWSGWSDADGDSDASTVAWDIGGSAVGSGTTLAGVFAKGDTVTCTVTPDDGTDTGTPVTAVVSVGNTEPVVSGVSISPASPTTDDVLTASASATDADGDTVSLSYDWTVDGSYVASGSTLDGALHFDRDQVVQVEVTPNDGSEDGATAASSSVTVLNSAPAISAVAVSPTTPGAGDTLTCSYSGYADADGDADASTIAWDLAGTAAGTGATYPGTPASGEVITCTVTPDDGTDTGTAVSATVTVDNTAPAIASVSISPDPATSGDTLTCSYSGFSDPDGDPDASTFAWSLGGTTVGTASTLSTGFARGDLVTCTVTPSDGTDAGTPLSASLTIANTAPAVSAVALSPSAPGTADTLVASASTSDADGDGVSLSYDWYVDGTYVTSGSASLDGTTWFDKGQSVTVEVTPSDGTDSGTALSSAAVTVVNTAPSVSAVSVDPDPPAPSDTLTCSYSGFSDADGDADASTYAWDVGGVSAGSGATLSGAFADGDLVTCTVTPDDGSDTGTPVSASVLVGNSAPSVGSVTITPDPATASDTLSCSYSGYSDPEGDADASTIAWDVGGTTVGTGSTLSSGFARDDLVTCTVTPSDGTDTGTPVSDSLVIDNTAPVISAVGLSPSPAYTDDTLTASASTSDTDGDSVSVSVDWTVDGTYVSTGATLAGTAFSKGQVIEATATPSDGTDSGAAVTSSSLTISNSAPSLTSATILPAAPEPGDTLTCGANGYSDADGDAAANSYAWDLGGTSVGSGASYSGTLADGDVVTCTITPSDGTDSGTAVSTSVTVSSSNSAPTVSAVSITPSSPQTDDVLTASASTSDADGDTVTVSYDWSVDGVYVATGATLDGATHFDKGQVVDVTATPSDGTTTGSSASHGGVTVVNTAPSVASASISPASPVVGDTLSCSANGYSDADGDADASTLGWDIGGTSVGTGATYAGTLADGDVVTCTITPSDGSDTGTDVSASVTVGSGNSAPVITAVAISPSSAQTDDTLTASASTTDADGDTVTVTYDWSVDGTYVWTGGTLDGATFFDRDQVVDVVATPHDGTELGSAASASSVTIANTAPSLSSASISPAAPTDSDTLTCSGSGYSDADGDADASTFAWEVNGTGAGTGASLAAGSFADGDTVTCTVTPHDGTDAGTAVTASVTIGSSNTAPTITTLSVSPSSPLTDDVLTATSSTFDADGDTVTVSYEWAVDGSVVATGATLDGATYFFDKGQTVQVSGTPNDGTTDGSTVSGSLLTVGNSAPAMLAASVSPSSPTATDTLTCSGTGFSDADGDADASTYSWAVNGTTVSTGTTLAGAFADGDAVTCTITPHDGTDSGSDVSATVTIGTSTNSAPSISAVVVSPNPAYDGDTLSCTYSGYSDADGDPDASFLAWTVNGSAAGSSATLSGSFGRDDSVVCTVTPFDGTDTGTPLSDSLIVSNTAPGIGSVALSPTSPDTDSTLTASASTSDADGDTVSVVYDWTVDGSYVWTGSTLDGALFFDKGQTVYVEATPDDGSDFGTPVSSSVVTIGNAAPSITSVSISPAAPSPSDTLVCSYGGFSDPDADADASTYAWEINGASAGSASTLSGGLSDGDAVTCTVTPHDGTDAGAALTDAVSVSAAANTPPEVTAVAISPSSPDTDDVLTASASTTDADGDPVTVTYDWDVNGSYVYTGATLDGATLFDRDDSVQVTATPNDGMDDGTSMTSSAVTVVNTAPTDPAISISPASPEEGVDDLICAIDTASTDLDGDGITYTFSWSVDGLAYPAGDTADTAVWIGPGTTIYTDDTVPAEDTVSGETWVCSVTADDGTDSSATVSTFVTVGAGAASDYSGTWTLDTAVSYTCAFGLVSLNFSQVIITDSNPTIVVAEASSQPGTMSGSFSTSVDWSANNTISGSCTESYTMTGTFLDANTFDGTFEADYTPAAGCLGCSYQSWTFTATK